MTEEDAIRGKALEEKNAAALAGDITRREEECKRICAELELAKDNAELVEQIIKKLEARASPDDLRRLERLWLACAVFAVTRELYKPQGAADGEEQDSDCEDEEHQTASARKGKGKGLAGPSPADTPRRKRARLAAVPETVPGEFLSVTKILTATKVRLVDFLGQWRTFFALVQCSGDVNHAFHGIEEEYRVSCIVYLKYKKLCDHCLRSEKVGFSDHYAVWLAERLRRFSWLLYCVVRASVLGKSRSAMSLSMYLVCAVEAVLRHAPYAVLRPEAVGHMDIESLCRIVGVSPDAVLAVRSVFNKFLGLVVNPNMLPLKCDKITVAGDPEAELPMGTGGMVVELTNVFGSAQAVSQNVAILANSYRRLLANARAEIDERLWLPTEVEPEAVMQDNAHEGLSALMLAAAVSQDMRENETAADSDRASNAVDILTLPDQQNAVWLDADEVEMRIAQVRERIGAVRGVVMTEDKVDFDTGVMPAEAVAILSARPLVRTLIDGAYKSFRKDLALHPGMSSGPACAFALACELFCYMLGEIATTYHEANPTAPERLPCGEVVTAMFACSLEAVIGVYDYSQQLPFPWSLGASKVTAYDFVKVLDTFVLIAGLNSSIVRHLALVSECALEKLVWADDSPVFAMLAAQPHPLPRWEEVAPVLRPPPNPPKPAVVPRNKLEKADLKVTPEKASAGMATHQMPFTPQAVPRNTVTLSPMHRPMSMPSFGPGLSPYTLRGPMMFQPGYAHSQNPMMVLPGTTIPSIQLNMPMHAPSTIGAYTQLRPYLPGQPMGSAGFPGARLPQLLPRPPRPVCDESSPLLMKPPTPTFEQPLQTPADETKAESAPALEKEPEKHDPRNVSKETGKEVQDISLAHLRPYNYTLKQRENTTGHSRECRAFLSRVYRLVLVRMEWMCETMGLPEDVRQLTWALLEQSLAEHNDILRSRHLDTVVLCAVYAGSRTIKEPPSFGDHIVHAYKSRYWKFGVSSEAVCQIPAVEGGCTIDKFYNAVYLPALHRDIVRLTKIHQAGGIQPYKPMRIECNAAPFPFRVSGTQDMSVTAHTPGANSRFEELPPLTKGPLKLLMSRPRRIKYIFGEKKERDGRQALRHINQVVLGEEGRELEREDQPPETNEEDLSAMDSWP